MVVVVVVAVGILWGRQQPALPALSKSIITAARRVHEQARVAVATAPT